MTPLVGRTKLMQDGADPTVKLTNGVGKKMPIATFATFVNQKILLPSSRTNYVAVEKSHLVDFMKPFLKSIYVDSDWYIGSNPDVAQAIFDGAIATAAEHYVTFGYYEHRMPYRIEVDADWYLAQYADVNEAVTSGAFASAQEHYSLLGYKEGRLPYANFILKLAAE